MSKLVKPLRSLEVSPAMSRASSRGSASRKPSYCDPTLPLSSRSPERAPDVAGRDGDFRRLSSSNRRSLKSGARTAPTASERNGGFSSRRRKSRAFVPKLEETERTLTFRPSPFVTSFPEPLSRPTTSLRPPRSLDFSYPPNTPAPETAPARLPSGSFTPRASGSISLEEESEAAVDPMTAGAEEEGTEERGGQGKQVPLSARGTRKEELEYLEAIISNPKRASSRKVFDRPEGGEVRRECLRACSQMCLSLRLPCAPALRVEESGLPFSAMSRRRKKDEVRKHKDASGVRAVFREYASEHRISAIRTALVRVLRKTKVEE